MTAENRQQVISHLNSLPLNRAAQRLLPPDWTNPGSLHVLTLAQWGTQQGIYPELEEKLGALLTQEPRAAMAYVVEAPDGSEVLHPTALDSLSPEEAASLILEAVSDRMNE